MTPLPTTAFALAVCRLDRIGFCFAPPPVQPTEFIHLQHLSQDKKAAIAMAAIYDAAEPAAIDFDHICDLCPHFNKAIALLQDLSKPGLLAVARAITEKLAVLEQLQEAGG